VRIYLDVSGLNRPFDDQMQARIRLESEAVVLILERCDRGQWTHVNSQMSVIEISAIRDDVRRQRVTQLLPEHIIPLTDDEYRRVERLMVDGFEAADAMHVAAAEAAHADVLLTCDDRLLRRCQKLGDQLRVTAANPKSWLEEQADASHT